MKQLRTHAAMLLLFGGIVAALALAYRPQLTPGYPLLVIATAVGILFLPRRATSPIPVLLVVSVLSAALRLAILGTSSWSQPEALVELAVLWVLVVASHRFSQSITEFEIAVEQVTLETVGTRLIGPDDADEAIANEFRFARRHDVPLSVLQIQPAKGSLESLANRTLNEVQMRLAHRYAIAQMANTVGSTLRRTDVVIEEQGSTLVVLCRETDRSGARKVRDNVASACAELLGIDVRVSTSSFPEDALTYDDLVTRMTDGPEPVEEHRGTCKNSKVEVPVAAENRSRVAVDRTA